MKRIGINKLISLISFVVLLIFSLMLKYKQYEHSVWIIIISSIVFIITVFYSFIPLFQSYKQKDNSKINKLSDYTFTDRHCDINHIIELLTCKERSIEITGKENQCGKTWLAKKICDYINLGYDKEFKSENVKKYLKIKMIIKKAYYIDMNNKTNDDINCFFENHIINRKVLLVIDHINDISYIISKQQIYHFQLVYILNTNTNGIDLYKHEISKFDENDIPLLQDKINETYPKIEKLTKKEIETLYEITNGNIGKIHKLLSRSEYIQWINDITHNTNTDYDIRLNEIQLNLYIGNYQYAKKLIKGFKNDYEDMYSSNNDLLFKIKLMDSDCEHLLNNYENALATLLPLKRSELKNFNNNFIVELHEAHYYKHLWKCNEALNILKSIEKESFSGMSDALGILSSKYFIDDLYVPYSNETSLEIYRKTYINAKNSNLHKSDDEILKLNRHEVIIKYYFNENTLDELIKIIDNVISLYEARNNRLLANAYFVRAEINRMFQIYEKTIHDYIRCLSVTDDNNIKIQVNIMMYYLDRIKKIQLDKFPKYMSKEEIISLCCNKNEYGKILISRINSIELKDPGFEKIKNCFDKRIMTIL